MNTNPHAWLRAALLALLFPLSALAAVQEIPITTSSADARLAFIAGEAALEGSILLWVLILSGYIAVTWPPTSLSESTTRSIQSTSFRMLKS